MSAGTTLALRPGDVVAGRYEVERVLGVGGMGAVVAARDRLAGPAGGAVAVKSLLPERAGEPDARARFAREARATARLKNEHVARVFESGTLPSGVPYIVMELLEGRDLKSWIKARGPLPFTEAAAYVCQASVALAEAHALGIVHRDLKPANLFLTRRPGGAAMIKVLDFGIAKFSSPNVSGDHLEVTRPRAVLGSRAYMAPEQMRTPRDVDARADVWALGAILYYLVTGKTPFAAATPDAVMIRVAHDAPQPLADLRPDLPPGFEAVMIRCLAKARDDRWANVTELARALAPFTCDHVLAGDRATAPLPRAPEPSAPSVRAVTLPTDAPAGDRPADEIPAPADATRRPHPPRDPHLPLRPLAQLAALSAGLACVVTTAVLRREAPPGPRSPPIVAARAPPPSAAPAVAHVTGAASVAEDAFAPRDARLSPPLSTGQASAELPPPEPAPARSTPSHTNASNASKARSPLEARGIEAPPRHAPSSTVPLMVTSVRRAP